MKKGKKKINAILINQMNFTLHNLPIISKILNKLDLVAKREGMVPVMKMIMAQTGNKLVVKNKTKELEKTLAKEPVLVICNHPAQAEVLILLSALAPRKDTYIIVSHHYTNILPHIDKQIIPVYVSQRQFEGSSWRFRLFSKLNPVRIINQQEAHQKNIDNIKLAAEKINKGGVVVIFPAVFEINNQFKPGVGHIINNLINPKDVRIVMAYVSGTSSKDYLRLIPGIKNLLPKMTLTFSEISLASTYWDSDAKVTAKNLENKYYGWVDSIEPKI